MNIEETPEIPIIALAVEEEELKLIPTTVSSTNNFSLNNSSKKLSSTLKRFNNLKMAFEPSRAAHFELSAAANQAPVTGVAVLDKSWENMQRKTFTNWVNSKLTSRKIQPIADLASDFSSGEKLINLLEIISGEDSPCGKYTKNPKIVLQKIENNNKALEFIKKRGVHLTNIGAEDIVNCNGKLILGLIWTIILRFTIAEISQEGLTAKEGLLLWCQRKTAPYSADFSIKDFTGPCWQNGLALCALIHRHRPDLLDYTKLNKGDKHANTQLAFDIAEEHLGIAKLFGVEDICDVVKPDERSVMTYVAQYFHAFSTSDKVGTAGRRIAQFGQFVQSAWEMQNDYERRCRSLLGSIKSIQQEWNSQKFTSYPIAIKLLSEFEGYKNTVKRTWLSEKRQLDSLFGNIQMKLKTYSLKPYCPPPELTLPQLDNSWKGLQTSEADRKRVIANFIREIKQTLSTKYANAANGFQAKLNEIAGQVASLDGELQAQLENICVFMGSLAELSSEVQVIESLNADCIEANIEVNEYTIYTVDDLTYEFSLLSDSLKNKSAFIKNQMVARTKTNITPELLEELTEAFRHFDKAGSNCLLDYEFKAALQASGCTYSDNEFEKIFKELSSDGKSIGFEQYIDFMKKIQEDRTGPEQLREAFMVMAGEKKEISEGEMLRGLPPTVVEYFKVVIPKNANESYNYDQYLSNAFI